MGDLSIEIECPDGNRLTLLPYSNHGGGTILGEPVATDLPVDGNTDDTTPGIGYDYCWSLDPIYATPGQLMLPIKR